MPTRVPRSASFWVVSIDDDALDDVPAEVMRAYESTRDFSILSDKWVEYDASGNPLPDDKRLVKWDGLDSLDVQPTRHFCQPLRPEYQRKVPAVLVPQVDVDLLWDIYAGHCEKVLNLLDGDGREIQIAADGKGRIPDYYRGDKDHKPTIPMKDFREVARVIVHKGTQGDTTPFTLQGTWQQSRLNRIKSRTARTGARARLERIAERSRSVLSSDSDSSESSTGDAGES